MSVVPRKLSNCLNWLVTHILVDTFSLCGLVQSGCLFGIFAEALCPLWHENEFNSSILYILTG